jgi:hypothetical protein
LELNFCGAVIAIIDSSCRVLFFIISTMTTPLKEHNFATTPGRKTPANFCQTEATTSEKSVEIDAKMGQEEGIQGGLIYTKCGIVALVQ